jgi:hypothetical protein
VKFGTKLQFKQKKMPIQHNVHILKRVSTRVHLEAAEEILQSDLACSDKE